MARFKFCLIGTAQAPVLDVMVSDIADLHRTMARARFVEGRMVEIGGEATDCVVLIPINRIQMIMEEQ